RRLCSVMAFRCRKPSGAGSLSPRSGRTRLCARRRGTNAVAIGKHPARFVRAHPVDNSSCPNNTTKYRPCYPRHVVAGPLLATHRSMAMLRGAVEAERAEREHADCARIDAAVALAEQDIAALEDRQLAPDEIRKQWFAIRDRTILAIRDVRNNIVKRANE